MITNNLPRVHSHKCPCPQCREQSWEQILRVKELLHPHLPPWLLRPKHLLVVDEYQTLLDELPPAPDWQETRQKVFGPLPGPFKATNP